MAKIEVIVCDVCRSQERKTVRFYVTEDGAVYALELCAEHAKPLRELLRHGTIAPNTDIVATRKVAQAKVAAKSKAAPARRRRGGFDAAVKTMEEIEASKRADA